MSTLYLVATPIGNLNDLSPRAQTTLATVDVIAAEDTRTSSVLLRHFMIKTPMVAFHAHNEAEAAKRLIAELQAGKSVALISDAGMPCIQDPGQRLVEAAHQHQISVIAIPGPNAAITAVALSGFPTLAGFVFLGFLPAKRTQRQKQLAQIKQHACPVVVYESPHRLLETLLDCQLVLGDDCQVSVSRELTKKFEETQVGDIKTILQAVDEQSLRIKGEFVLVLQPKAIVLDEEAEHAAIEPWLKALAAELPVKQATSIAVAATGLAKNTLYALLLDLKKLSS